MDLRVVSFFSCGLVVFAVFLLWACGFFAFFLAAGGADFDPNLTDQRGAKNSGAGLPPNLMTRSNCVDDRSDVIRFAGGQYHMGCES